jgi:hypothetical protein
MHNTIRSELQVRVRKVLLSHQVRRVAEKVLHLAVAVEDREEELRGGGEGVVGGVGVGWGWG